MLCTNEKGENIFIEDEVIVVVPIPVQQTLEEKVEALATEVNEIKQTLQNERESEAI